MRLIDADALEFSYFAHIENYSIHPEYSEDYKRGFNNAVMRDIGIINNAPTVETRPTATWERFGTFCNGNVDRKCSNCGSFDEQAENAEVPYCWFCGAKMEVKNETDN